MKYLKQKLMAAVAMLVISTIMLTSASYAWFTISTAPEVTEVTTTITANHNFEIALGTTEGTKPTARTDATDGNKTGVEKDRTWGATITSVSEIATFKGLGAAVLDGGKIKTMKYGVDGRPMNAFNDTTSTTIANGVADIKDVDGNVIGKTILVWLKTNVAGTVSVAVDRLEFAGATANGDYETYDDDALVQVAFEYDGSIKGPLNKTTSSVSLGNIAANTAVPVKIHIYLDGVNITNKDVSSADFTAKIGSIVFTNSAIETPYLGAPVPSTQQGSGGTGNNPS